jgi:phenylalanyl-tRNA synthetase beta chain
LPVVRVDLARFSKMVGVDRKKILDRLPYIGLDIESVDKDSVRVEYSPNRPDFGTDFGIARALRGILGKEVGLPKFPTSASGISVSVDPRLSTIRPFIACVTAARMRLDDEDVRQIISLQEDLHNGLGRKRKTVAIGIHDLAAVKPPFSYRAVPSSFKFLPLGQKKAMEVGSILSQTEEGRAYGPVFAGSEFFPIISDAKGEVLSFPPIINGEATKVTSRTRNLFIDVTSTDRKAGDDVLAVMATTLSTAGGTLGTVKIKHPGKTRITPDLSPTNLPLDLKVVKATLGMDLTQREIHNSLARSRLGVKRNRAQCPRYRIDLLHPVDIAEEVALGYGMDRIGPVYPPSKRPGKFNDFEEFLDSVATIMAGSGMIELMTFELTDERSLYSRFGRPSSARITVQNPRSIDHSVLRDALLPPLMAALSGNVKSDYPQRVFEVGRVFARTKEGVSETWHLGCLVAHSHSSYTEAKMYLESALRTIAGKEVKTPEEGHWAFAQGRCARVVMGEAQLGHVGEVRPESIEAFGLGVPVAGFEVNLTQMFELLK